MKPPRQSIRTLIRKAIAQRYSLTATIDRAGNIKTECIDFGNVADWWTTRSYSECVELRNRHMLFFKFAPDA